jgi:glycosyltransferase family protein
MNGLSAILLEKIRYNCVVEFYNLLYLLARKRQKIIPDVLSIDESIRRIVSTGASVSRFGDGEMLLIGGRPIRFQKESTLLSERLKEVMASQQDGHLVCISDTFEELSRYTRSARRFWRTHFYLYGDLWDRYLVGGRTYGNTFITRPYIDFKLKEQSAGWFNMLKTIWNKRDLLVVEGEKSRLGVGNDLFDNAASIRRILSPPLNAFEKYDLILEEVSKQDKGVLVLLALGPTATVLAYDLHKIGYQAIDIGHVDIEYEWFRMGARRKVSVPSKYVNEALTGREIGMTTEESYFSQIICKI